MATIVLSAAGAGLGASLGGSVLGLSSVVLGRAAGAALGRVIDQSLLGAGAEPVETGRVDRFRLTGASEGAPVTRLWGRMRLAGQVIWASRFREEVSTGGGGGKGGPQQPEVREYSYSVSLAVALCEGPALHVGRIWADGVEIAPAELTLRVYDGGEAQMPDPKIEAVEGAGNAPAYRGIAYVVIEDLALERFGNRVPQFSFEVVRAAAGEQPDAARPLSDLVTGVALVPGTGEYALATTPVHYNDGPGVNRSANVHSPSGKTDFATSMATLRGELPRARSALTVVSWFGDDLRCGACALRPKVEQTASDGEGMPWAVSGLARSAAQTVVQEDGRPVYGGTPADAAVIEALTALREAGQEAVFYPFILMEQLSGNALADPWTGEAGQPRLPWRGRITTSRAPGQPGTPDGTAAAEAEVAAFFGTARPGDFTQDKQGVAYTGPAEWSYRRFILHYAHLCAAAGGVAAFCIGSEMRSLTQIRGPANAFPAVAALRTLAQDVRAILGPETRIGYAADWSEYFGFQPQDGSGDVFFHLDPLWADPGVDFVGIDNYMPLADWREGDTHADAGQGQIYELGYLQGNIEGGEGFDWFYADAADRVAQTRTPITDGAHGEPWVFRYKDLRNWWVQKHHERIGGVRQAGATDWVPQSKPIWFTEFGCAAVDKGANQPNRFLDPKSSESGLPHFSDGSRDDLMQAQYLRAVTSYWQAPENNPVSQVYGAPMIDTGRMHAWAWDTRPFPRFPGNAAVWADAANYDRGHWLNGRASAQSLAGVVREICADAGVAAVDTGNLHGLVRGYTVGEVSGARAALQPLMLAHGLDAAERDGRLVFSDRTGKAGRSVAPDRLAVPQTRETESAAPVLTRAPEAETAGRVRVTFVESEGDYATRAEETVFPGEESAGVAQTEFPMLLTRGEGRALTERWLAEARVARDTAAFALAPSDRALGAGDVVGLPGPEPGARWRIDRVSDAGAREVEAVRVEPSVFRPSDAAAGPASLAPYAPALPVFPLFLDLPLLTGDEVAHAPHVAATATPWPGSVAVYSAAADNGYRHNTVLRARAAIGVTETPLAAAPAGVWDRGPELRVHFPAGEPASASMLDVLNGANAAAIGDGTPGNWEVFQFAEAELVAPATYALRLRLRGQAGTDAVVPVEWPAGSYVVLLDGAPRQIELAPTARGLARHYRIGPARQPLDDASYIHLNAAFDGVGLRPYAPVHPTTRRAGGGDLAVEWIRRTRIDGDSWASVEVPLGEERERYAVRVVKGGAVLRRAEVGAPAWSYPAAEQAEDGAAPPFAVEVAQISDRFGPGPSRRIEIDD